jgi:protein SCO1/2
VRQRVGFTLVTIDAERDTPEALRTYRERQQLPADGWTLLRGGADDTLELAALLGVKYKREASGQFAHSNLITILDAEGEIVYQQVGLNREPGEAAKAIQRAATSAGRVRASD